GKWYHFSCIREAVGVEHERRSCVVRIEWQGASGEVVESPEPVNPRYRGVERTLARPEFPRDLASTGDGGTQVEGTYRVPDEATTALVQLHLRWAPDSRVNWRKVAFEQVPAPETRKVTLAAVHTKLSGSGRSVAENRELFRPFIEEAAKGGADLVVLPELLTCKGVTSDYASVAETIPGPTTDFFGELSKDHGLYLVIGLPERDGELVYNVAVLLGPDGSIIGTYRKVTLPREEIARGIAPGEKYPVFETSFGKVGMMICYDVFFPEVARELAMAGAEVIALPIWGGNPLLAAARCAENGVYLATSTYTDHESNWMKSAIWDREGDRIATAEEWESVVFATVDLNERTYWDGLGDFSARIAREAPVRKAEEPDFELRSE
ncbi:MAG: carbon-nitrogen hydrolase family protein, partial [Verrucomicrobiota bacterium]